jgi:hypothetical protein
MMRLSCAAIALAGCSGILGFHHVTVDQNDGGAADGPLSGGADARFDARLIDAGPRPDSPMPDAGVPPGSYLHSVMTGLVFPSGSTGFNLDGDSNNRIDNALGAVLNSLAAQNIDFDNQSSITAGDVIWLQSVKTTPGQAQPIWFRSYQGSSTPTPPKFDGSDVFTLAPGQPVDDLLDGTITAGGSIMAGPGPIPMPIEMWPGIGVMTVHLVGAYVSGSASASGINGLVGGGIPKVEVDNVIVPQLANALDARAGMTCTGPSCTPNAACRTGAASANYGSCDAGATSIYQLFDTSSGAESGTCNTSADCGATNCDLGTHLCECCPPGNCQTDGRISVDEIRCNGLITSLLQPDVDLLDANGNYGPTPAGDPGAVPDCLSVAFTFNGVPATFTSPSEP